MAAVAIRAIAITNGTEADPLKDEGIDRAAASHSVTTARPDGGTDRP